MNEFDPRRLTLSEAELEQTLRDFFAAEMPAELRGDGDAEGLSSAPVTPLAEPRRTRRVAAAVAVAVAVAGFAVTVGLSWWLNDDQRPTAVAPRPRTPALQNPGELLAQQGDHPSTAAAEDDSLEVSSRREALERQIYETGGGPVEQRTDVVWTDVSYYEPETGASVQWSVPELTIEILPLQHE